MSAQQVTRKGELRLRAEKAVRETRSALSLDRSEIPVDDIQRLLHELSVHEIELTMQNEELHLAEQALIAERKRYFDLYDLAPIGYLTINEAGRIVQANRETASLLGLDQTQLVDQPFTRFILPADQAIYYLFRQRMLQSSTPQACELKMFKHNFAPISVEATGRGAIHVQRAQLFRMVLVDITERKATEAMLRQSEVQLRALSRRVLEVQEAERRLVAIELHDQLGQSLTAIKINLQANAHLQDQEVSEQTSENIRIVDDALQQVRSLALSLRPPMLDDLGLVPALRWMAGQHSERSGFVTNLYAARLPGRLDPDIEVACFRIVQEALTNIARYARPTTVAIILSDLGSDLVLSVQDDGCGFDVDASRAKALAGKSVGVLGMEQRAGLVGGSLVIESTPGSGSTVRLRCPLRLREVAP